MPGFDYNTAIDAIVTVLKNANTTTSTPDLSASLTTRIVNDNITDDDPNIVNVRNDRLPAIYVRLEKGDEDFESIGETGSSKNRKEKIVNYSLFALMQKDGAHASRRSVSRMAAQLAQNIEAVFQQNYKIGSTNLWMAAKSTTFAGFPLAEGSWVKAVLIEVEGKYHFR